MALIQWDNSLSVGITEIDEQHTRLVSIVNSLHEAMKSGKSKEAMGEILGSLINYTKSHFAFEEKYFDLYRYENAVSHKAEHKKLTDQVLDFQKKFNSGAVALSVELMNFLSDWLKNHIKGEDKQYSKCFQEHGMK